MGFACIWEIGIHASHKLTIDRRSRPRSMRRSERRRRRNQAESTHQQLVATANGRRSRKSNRAGRATEVWCVAWTVFATLIVFFEVLSGTSCVKLLYQGIVDFCTTRHGNAGINRPTTRPNTISGEAIAKAVQPLSNFFTPHCELATQQCFLSSILFTTVTK